MKVLLCVCVLIAIVQCAPVEKEVPKDSAKNFAPVEVSEDNAGEEGVDLQAAEAYGYYGRRHYGGYGHHGYGGYGGYGHGYGYGRRGWGHGSYSNSFSSEYWG
uniref:Putative neuropeptide-like protein 31 n=1 Tax=Nyssomyia neivai TaxID=330878 RepID=A0A1L8DQI5_9DIPT